MQKKGYVMQMIRSTLSLEETFFIMSIEQIHTDQTILDVFLKIRHLTF